MDSHIHEGEANAPTMSGNARRPCHRREYFPAGKGGSSRSARALASDTAAISRVFKYFRRAKPEYKRCECRKQLPAGILPV